MAERAFFITGATGLLGTEVVAELLRTTADAPIRVLVRASSTDEAAQRLLALWWGDELLTGAVQAGRVVPVVGDITLPDLGLSADDRQRLQAETTHVVHCAAETGVLKSKAELWNINVEGTRQVAATAQTMSRLQRFTYVSTAYVAGTQSGLIGEEAPTATCFYSLYEQSKAEAECYVRATELPLTICRPGMIVGNSQTGRTRNFNTVYYVLKLLLQGKLRLLPVGRQQTVNVVPVDEVARCVAALTLHPQALGQTFHIVAPHDQLPRVGELIDAVRRWADSNLLYSVPRPLFVPLPFLRAVGQRHNAGNGEKSRNLRSNLTALMPYFLDQHQFDRTNTDRLLGPYRAQWQSFLPALLQFACRHNFMRITDKSIFRQAMERRASKHHPINYFDITADDVRQTTGEQMNALVESYVEKLRQMGLKPGDRVALMGHNSTQLAALDCAIGLVGAVSVPIYYTTPPEEIELLLSKSGARCFLNTDFRDFFNLSTIIEERGEFLEERGERREERELKIDGRRESQMPLAQRSSPLATIRYTSGTTGEPKGVMFSQAQLKWMGQVLTNLLPWKQRNSEMRYLSFLPMSHVVEGILAAYAPYCMLCKASIYYLNDFHQLADALPKVRPTVFFSVPRFYEKLWQQIEQNPLGQRYLAMSEGPLKRLTAKLLRRAVLRKAGLDQCSQLLVGSAPVSPELLLRFRALGIEIYNAYGQTEAPLITLNRLGDNVIPCVGTPLPDTNVSLAPDGELLVSGPQVALGYYRQPSTTFDQGILHTGDLGTIDALGHVSISGRKKDLLITSYGKNINCAKIEQRLCDIPCVEQAVLVGEQRPYCTALLWISGSDDTLASDIEQMNATLSHPEQIKRWRIMDKPLSIAGGELTPNLKVKRQVVWEHYEPEIDHLYAAE